MGSLPIIGGASLLHKHQLPPSQRLVTLYHYVAPCLCWLSHGLISRSSKLIRLYNSVVSLAVAVNNMAESFVSDPVGSGADANKTFERTLKSLDGERSQRPQFHIIQTGRTDC